MEKINDESTISNGKNYGILKNYKLENITEEENANQGVLGKSNLIEVVNKTDI